MRWARVSSNRVLIIFKDGDATTSLDSSSALDHSCGENIFPAWVFPYSLPLILLPCISKRSLAPSSLYPPVPKLQAAVRLQHSSSSY